MSITKSGLWTSSTFQENYGSWVPIEAFSGGSKSGNIFTITSSVTTSTWGSGVSIPQGPIYVPHNYIYRVSFDAYVSTAHSIQIDVNNTRADGGTNWSGNDNDYTSARTGTNFSIPANTWTTVTWGSANTNSNNTDKAPLFVYDNIGLITSADTAAVSWQIRNPKFIIYKDTQTVASIGKDGTTHSNNFYEL